MISGISYFASDADEEETQSLLERFAEEAVFTPEDAKTIALEHWGKADRHVWLVIDGKLAWRLD